MSKFITPANIYLPGYHTLFCIMKKLIFTLSLLIAITTISSYAQRDDNDNSPYAPIYLTFTSINSDTYVRNGIYRHTMEMHDTDKINPINFSYLNENKAQAYFVYAEYNFEVLRTYRELTWEDSLYVRTEPVSFLESNNVIDIDEMFSAMTKEEIWEFTNTLQDKRVFFIDKNPDFGEVTRDSVKIYRVKYYGNNQPVDDVVYEE